VRPFAFFMNVDGVAAAWVVGRLCAARHSQCAATMLPKLTLFPRQRIVVSDVDSSFPCWD